MRSIRQRLRDERGSSYLMEFTMLGITLMVPLMYMMLGAFEIQRAMYGVTAAARDATRAFTLGSDCDNAHALGEAAARVALDDQKMSYDELSDEDIYSDPEDACLEPDSVAVARFEYQVPIPLWPDILGQAPSIRVTAEHRTPYGQFRQSGT